MEPTPKSVEMDGNDETWHDGRSDADHKKDESKAE